MIAKEKLNILWSLEQTAEKYADRVAVSDVNQELTWKELVKKAQVIGAELSEKVQPGNPVPVLLEKSSETLAVMLGIVYAGCFYVPVNPMNPTERLRKIMEKLDPEVIISDEKGKEQLAAVGNGLEEKVIGPETLLPTTGTDLSEEQRSKLEQIQERDRCFVWNFHFRVYRNSEGDCGKSWSSQPVYPSFYRNL